MKMQLKSTLVKGLLGFLVAAMLSTTAFAGGNNPGSNANINPAKVSFTGAKNEMLQFKVEYKNELAQPFVLIIKNEMNEVIYNRSFDAKPINFNIGFVEVPEDYNLTFSIKTANKEFNQTFTITKESSTVTDFIVKGE